MMMHSIPKLNKTELRNFGLLFAIFFVALFGLIIPLIRGHSLPNVPWIIASVFVFLAIIFPIALQPIYQIWMRFGLVLGWVNSRIILGIIFYGLVLPMGVLMRLLKRDPMHRQFQEKLDSYRLSSHSVPKSSMETPY